MAFHGIGSSSGSIDCARPLLGSTSISAAASRTSSLATSNCDGVLQQEALQHPVGAKTDDRLVGPGHADVGHERGAVGQDALVGGRHVGVGAEHRRHRGRRGSQPIACFSLVASAWKSTMITLTLPASAGDQPVGLVERRVERRHEDLAFEVDGRDRDARRRLADVEPAARGCRSDSWRDAGCWRARRGAAAPPSCPRCGCRW